MYAFEVFLVLVSFLLTLYLPDCFSCCFWPLLTPEGNILPLNAPLWSPQSGWCCLSCVWRGVSGFFTKSSYPPKLKMSWWEQGDFKVEWAEVKQTANGPITSALDCYLSISVPGISLDLSELDLLPNIMQQSLLMHWWNHQSTMHNKSICVHDFYRHQISFTLEGWRKERVNTAWLINIMATALSDLRPTPMFISVISQAHAQFKPNEPKSPFVLWRRLKEMNTVIHPKEWQRIDVWEGGGGQNRKIWVCKSLETGSGWHAPPPSHCAYSSLSVSLLVFLTRNGVKERWDRGRSLRMSSHCLSLQSD